MIPPSTRLRRAILLNDVLLVHRILKNHPLLLYNTDYTDKSNTSLHLAAEAGFTEIVHLLLTLGHDATEVSRTTEHNTPLMLAAKHGRVDTGVLLITQCKTPSVHLRNAAGLDALALAATCPNSVALIPVLLNHGARVDGVDLDGNTALHHASASGSLKASRILLGAGANPQAMNYSDWTPLAYSQTVAAEVYFKNLIQEDLVQKRSVQNEEDQMIGDALKRHWSPVDRRRPGTPGGTTPRHEWGSPPLLSHVRTKSGDGRTRAESG